MKNETVIYNTLQIIALISVIILVVYSAVVFWFEGLVLCVLLSLFGMFISKLYKEL